MVKTGVFKKIAALTAAVTLVLLLLGQVLSEFQLRQHMFRALKTRKLQ